MKLFYKAGACSLASHITLNELGIKFELDQTNTETGETESGINFFTINPNGYVPAILTDEGDVLTENPAVLQYLADQKPSIGLAPKAGTFERAQLQELLNFASSELHKAFSPFFSGEDLDKAARDKAAQKILRRAEHIEQTLSDGRDYLLGNSFTVADAYIFVILNWANFVAIDLSRYSKIQAFMNRVSQRPAVIQAMITEGLIQQEKTA